MKPRMCGVKQKKSPELTEEFSSLLRSGRDPEEASLSG